MVKALSSNTANVQRALLESSIKTYDGKLVVGSLEEYSDVAFLLHLYGARYWPLFVRALVAGKDSSVIRVEDRALEYMYLKYRRLFSRRIWLRWKRTTMPSRYSRAQKSNIRRLEPSATRLKFLLLGAASVSLMMGG